MSLHSLPADHVRTVLADAVRDTIVGHLVAAQPGHCLRASNLPETVMRDLVIELNENHPGADIVLLLGPWQQPKSHWEVSATRLIELRNAGKRPLLVFVPPGLKTAAEDSFDVSTFVELDLGDLPPRLRSMLRSRLPEGLQLLTDQAIQYLKEIERLIADDDVIRYYLTILHNQTGQATDETEPLDLLALAGGAIYQLHLVPDFDLYRIPDRIKQRLSQNTAALRTLIDSANPLLGRVHELKLKPGTIQSDIYALLRSRPIDDVRGWGGDIATNPALRHLAFDRWQFEDEQDREHLLLYVDDLDMPARDRNAPIGPDNPRYLDIKRATGVRLRWFTEPKPAAANGLAYFRVEIISTDPAGGAIAWESKNIAVGKSAQASRSTTLKVADWRDQVEDGLYYFRVRAYSETGEILNEEDADTHPEILRDPRSPDGKRRHETEDVWFWVDPQEEPPPAEPPRNVTVESFLEAQLLARLAAIERGDDPFSSKLVPKPEQTGWATAKGKRTEATYNIVYDAQARFTLSISNRLRQIESDTLRQPENLGRWRLNLAGQHDLQQAETTVRPYHAPDRVPRGFRQARATLFAAIQGGADDRLTATVDLADLTDLILAYARTYVDWLAQVQADFQQQAIREEDGRRRTDPLFLDIDLVEILLPGDGPAPDRVYLMAPTHPLRLLWHLQRAGLVTSWLHEAQGTGHAGQVLTAGIRAFLRRGLIPVNLPPALRAGHEGHPEGISRFYVEHGPLTIFWGLYLREDIQDSRTLQARVQAALGISRHLTAGSEISPDVLTHNLLRYLVQHPYVHALKLNVFNPGHAGLVVDAILGVERARVKARLPGLRYELRLFTHSDRVDDVGSAVEELLNPERQVSAEADAFAIASRNPLYPKLRFSRNSLKEFQACPENYEAHLSILYDLFPVEVVLAPLGGGRSSFLHGLIQEQVTHFAGDEAHYAWQRQLVPAPCRELPGDDETMGARLAELLARIATLQASVAAGKPVAAVPTLQLNLGPRDKNLLYQVHGISDWVLTIDRHLGLDYFDADAPDDRPIYLLDFRPEFGGTDTDRLLLTTRSVDEIRRLIRPILDDYELSPGQDVEVYFLRLLRSLSGRLALKLLSAPSQVGEALGLAFARLFLEQYDLLDQRIIVPLDAHGDLFAAARSGDDLQQDISLQRGDLLLISCDPATRTLHFQIIEVKFQSDLGGFSAYMALQQRIEGQIANSENVLRQHFDPHRAAVDRLDRQVKTKELISLLSFYLARSCRYGLVSADAVEPLRAFIESLDEGYRLECTGAGLIFDLGARDVEVNEEHLGLVFYRVGRDYVQRLLNNGLRRRAVLQRQVHEKPATIEDSERQEQERRQLVRDTTLRSDPTFERVRTHFDLTPLPRQDVPPARKAQVVVEPPPEPAAAKTPEPEVGTDAEPQSHPVVPPEPAPAPSPASAPPPAPEPRPRQDVPSELAPTPNPVTAPPIAPELQLPIGIESVPVTGPETPVAPAASASPTPETPSVLPASGPSYDVLLGDTAESRQYGLLGVSAGKRVALDLNGTNTISLFGVQGGGKSYTVGTVVEMATQALPGVNLVPSPLASVIFHYHESQDYPPEFVSMVEPNSAEEEVESLVQEFGSRPSRLDDVLILTSADKLERRRAEFPSVQVEPIYFSSNELSFKDWRFLMGVAGNQMYMKQIALIMRELRERMTLDTLRREIEGSELSDGQKTIARIRLNFAAQFIDDARNLASVLRPGRLIIVDLRDEFIDKDEALGLFVVMLNIFANAGHETGRPFNKLIVFDEAHKYMDNPDLTGHIVDVIRQMRHQGVSVLIASQDPPSLPNAIIELSSLVILHRFNSPQWLKHVQRSITALSDLTAAQMASLRPGDAYVWATKATERVFTQKAVKMRFRPRVTRHGGGTRMAV